MSINIKRVVAKVQTKRNKKAFGLSLSTLA